MTVGLLAGTGCSGLDGAAVFDDDAGTDGSGPASDEEGTGSIDETGADSTGLPPSDDSGETGEVGDPACPYDCGAGGYCELDEDEIPYCACDEGYAAYGLRCLPCSPTDGQLDVDIPRVMVSASFLLDGGDFPASSYEFGTISLRDPKTGDEIDLGQTRHGGTLDDVAVLPGPYDVIYSRVAGGDVVPANHEARVDTVTIPEEPVFDLVVDVPRVELSGNLTFNGAAPPASTYENGLVVLRDRTTGDEIELGETRHGDFSRVVVPSSYDVHYRSLLSDTIAPVNPDAIVGSAVVDDLDESQQLDIDIPVSTLSGDVRLDGAVPPNSTYENGELRLHDLRTETDLVLGQTREGSYEVAVISGEYEVVYRRLLGGDEVPVNTAAVLGSVFVSDAVQSHDIDILTAVVTGTITVGGAAPPSDPANDGLIVLRNSQTGDEARLGSTRDGAYSRRVVQSEYDVHYRQETSSGGVPVNTNALLQTIDVQGGANFPVDVPMVTVSASVTLNGQVPPDSAYDDGLLYLRNPQTGDSVLLGNTRLAALQRPVVPATYDLVYVVEAAGPTVPVNAQAHLATVDVGTTPNLMVDIPVTTLTGTVTVAGETPSPSSYDRAELFVHDVLTNDDVPLGRIDLGVLTQSLTAGTYVLVYRDLTSSGEVPANRDAGLSCFELTAE